MAKEKFDFEAYAKWCEENHLEASESPSLERYKVELEKTAQTSEKAVKTAKQKEVFDAIAEYLGVNVKYDGEYFDDLEKSLKAICFAMSMCCLMKDVRKSADKIADAYGLGEKEDD